MIQDVKNWRVAMCQSFIEAGKTTAEDIIAEVTKLEDFVFGKQVGEAQFEPVLTEAPVASVVEEQSSQVRDELQDAEQTDAPTFTADDVKSALMQVAKKSRSELQRILSHFAVANVSAIRPDQYAAVVAMTEETLETADA
ncbi:MULTISPECIES: hypothetical protein [Acinetobacter]|uniref:hypothetical protein n=1 Tax=Acinetobacter TaxID=469 RepID=UPI0002D0ACA3|nr:MULTISPECIES: hypothetical protein [Acinetobacter]ENW90531.1 hypothetical protein F905_00554 [Acinetobacter sp. CIP 53.82]MBA0154551.1 hypothetical protein [Acinetobacter indicus]